MNDKTEWGLGGTIKKSRKEGDITIIDEFTITHVSMNEPLRCIDCGCPLNLHRLLGRCWDCLAIKYPNNCNSNTDKCSPVLGYEMIQMLSELHRDLVAQST